MLTMIGLPHVVTLSAALLAIGVMGMFLNRKNLILLLMCLELVLLAANLNFVAFSVFYEELSGQVFTFFILTIAAAEVAIGLAIITVFFRQRQSVDVDEATALKG